MEARAGGSDWIVAHDGIGMAAVTASAANAIRISARASSAMLTRGGLSVA